MNGCGSLKTSYAISFDAPELDISNRIKVMEHDRYDIIKVEY